MEKKKEILKRWNHRNNCWYWKRREDYCRKKM